MSKAIDGVNSVNKVQIYMNLSKFAVWLDTRTKSTVDQFEANTPEKTREHVRVSIFWRWGSGGGNLVSSTKLIMLIGHHKEFLKISRFLR